MKKLADQYEAAGGSTACLALATAFYARVARDSTLRPLFPGKTFRCAIEEFAAFLAQFLDGPAEDARKRWWLSLRESHLRFKIGQKERDAWMQNMRLALDDVAMTEPTRGQLLELFEQSSAYVANSGPPVPAAGCIHGEMGQRWDEQRALDEAVAAAREGNLGRVAALVEGPLHARFERGRYVLANFVGILIGCGGAMSGYARGLLPGNPDIVHERYSGRTLLHAASAAGDVSIVELLLQMGADANSKDRGGHTPLYSVSNECARGGDVARTLIAAGAKVDACAGVKHCTPLHMAARRGNAQVSGVLLESGAMIEARDSLGDTPLRRAVNCAKTDVAALLVARGADIHSIGNKGLTPLSAARGAIMIQLLRP